jgi:hypothetical protein
LAVENCIIRSLVTCTLRPYNYNDRIKEDEIGKARRTQGGEEEYIQNFYGKIRRKETTRAAINYSAVNTAEWGYCTIPNLVCCNFDLVFAFHDRICSLKKLN